jgi:ribosomal protein L37AE/L43A
MQPAIPDAPSPADPYVVVFRPLQKITWPNHCVKCMADEPQELLKLNVYGATKTSTATKAGGVAGAFAGAIVGGIVGGIASAASGETSEYMVPICDDCLSRVRGDEKTALATCEFKMLSKTPRITTSVMHREFDSWHVVLTLSNERYANAFRAANPGLVFDSVAASKAGKAAVPETEGDHPAQKPKEKPKCPRCGREVVSSGWTCPHCGRTDWGAAVTGVVMSAGLVAVGLYVCDPGTWRWVWIGFGGLFGLVTFVETIKALAASGKRAAPPPPLEAGAEKQQEEEA